MKQRVHHPPHAGGLHATALNPAGHHPPRQTGRGGRGRGNGGAASPEYIYNPDAALQAPHHGRPARAGNNNAVGIRPIGNGSGSGNGAHHPPHQLKRELYKTEMCKSFEQFGTCRYAEKCQFAHGVEQLRMTRRHPKYKSRRCRNFAVTGTCSYGKRCMFLHEMGPIPVAEVSRPLKHNGNGHHSRALSQGVSPTVAADSSAVHRSNAIGLQVPAQVGTVPRSRSPGPVPQPVHVRSASLATTPAQNANGVHARFDDARAVQPRLHDHSVAHIAAPAHTAQPQLMATTPWQSDSSPIYSPGSPAPASTHAGPLGPSTLTATVGLRSVTQQVSWLNLQPQPQNPAPGSGSFQHEVQPASREPHNAGGFEPGPGPVNVIGSAHHHTRIQSFGSAASSATFVLPDLRQPFGLGSAAAQQPLQDPQHQQNQRQHDAPAPAHHVDRPLTARGSSPSSSMPIPIRPRRHSADETPGRMQPGLLGEDDAVAPADVEDPDAMGRWRPSRSSFDQHLPDSTQSVIKDILSTSPPSPHSGPILDTE